MESSFRINFVVFCEPWIYINVFCIFVLSCFCFGVLGFGHCSCLLGCVVCMCVCVCVFLLSDMCVCQCVCVCIPPLSKQICVSKLNEERENIHKAHWFSLKPETMQLS